MGSANRSVVQRVLPDGLHSRVTSDTVGSVGTALPLPLEVILRNPDSPIFCLKPHLPVAGRLCHFVPFWRQVTSDPWVLDIVQNGCSLELLRVPPSRGIRHTPLKAPGSSVLLDEVAGLLEKCAVESVMSCQADGYCSTYFTVPKKDGGVRPILNLKRFNRFIKKRTFKMESLQSVISLMQPGLWLASIDLKDAYFHIPINRKHWKYLRFCIAGKVYQYRVTPFGLSSAPRVFTKILLVLVAFLRSQGVQIYAYLDDLLIAGQSPQQTLWALNLTLDVLTQGGFIINVKKSDLTPTQDLVYIGGRFNTAVGRVFLPLPRLEALIKCVTTFMQVGRSFSARLWLQLLGVMAATIPTVQWARLNMRPVQFFLMKSWSAKQGLDFSVMMSRSLVPCLRWWAERSNLVMGLPFQPLQPELTVTTDSSMEGWGGHMQLAHEASAALFSGDWSVSERSLHINLLELRAIRLTLNLLTPRVAGRVVKCECDNSTAVAYINKQGGTRSVLLYHEVLQLFQWARLHQVTLLAVHRPGVDNILADYLSRNRADPREWSLNPRLCQRLFKMWGVPQVDLFAVKQNAQLPVWYSRCVHPEAMATDAFSQRWTGLYVYAFPPFNLIQRTLTKLLVEGVEEAIVVVPNWPGRPWYNLLLEIACETPVRFQTSLDLLSQTLPNRGTLFHPDLRKLALTAWKLNAAPGNRPGLLKRSLTRLSRQRDPLPEQSMMPVGLHTLPGAQSGATIPFLCL